MLFSNLVPLVFISEHPACFRFGSGSFQGAYSCSNSEPQRSWWRVCGGSCRVSDEESRIVSLCCSERTSWKRDVSWATYGGGGGSERGKQGVRLSGEGTAWARTGQQGLTKSSQNTQLPSLVTWRKRRQSCSDPARWSPGAHVAARPTLPAEMGHWHVSFRKQLLKLSIAIHLKMTHDPGVCLSTAARGVV